MHSTDLLPDVKASSSTGPWWRELSRYHWFVLVVAALGWMADCMDQQLFLMARRPAMKSLVTDGQDVQLGSWVIYDVPAGKQVDFYSDVATSIFLFGWATGGLIFGVLGDRIGRAKTMLLTVLLYSLCTGLSALSVGFWDFAFYRLVTGMGVGGEFAVGVALVAEVMPSRARPFALGLLQALSAIGNITAALVNIGLAELASQNVIEISNAWRWMFVVGALPAVLAIFIRWGLKEPDRWKETVQEKNQKVGSYGELFGDARWRNRALLGLLLASAGVIGLWAIGFYSFDLLDAVLTERFTQEGLAENDVKTKVAFWKGIASIVQNFGGFLGIYSFSIITAYTGRKPAFAVSFVLALGSTALVFWSLSSFTDVFWMLPLMGFCQLALFGGYAIYFPELFPTRLRSTGTSFCYNVGRYVAVSGPLLLTLLRTQVFSAESGINATRYAGVTMCAVFLIGLMALPFAPETKGKPLPEEAS